MHVLNVTELSGLREKITGLLGAEKGYPVHLKTRFGIHTFGMKFPIDVVVLDDVNRVVKISHHLKPNRLFFWPPIFNQVIELPAGDVQKHGITIGDTIELDVINR